MPCVRQLPVFFTDLVRLCTKQYLYHKAVGTGLYENPSDMASNYAFQLVQGQPLAVDSVAVSKTEVLSEPQ